MYESNTFLKQQQRDKTCVQIVWAKFMLLYLSFPQHDSPNLGNMPNILFFEEKKRIVHVWNGTRVSKCFQFWQNFFWGEPTLFWLFIVNALFADMYSYLRMCFLCVWCSRGLLHHSSIHVSLFSCTHSCISLTFYSLTGMAFSLAWRTLCPY